MPGEVVLGGGIVVRRLVLEGFGELEQWWDKWVVAMEAGSGEGTTRWRQGWLGWSGFRVPRGAGKSTGLLGRHTKCQGVGGVSNRK